MPGIRTPLLDVSLTRPGGGRAARPTQALHVAVVHAGGRIRFVTAAPSRTHLVAQLARYVRDQAPSQLWPEGARRVQHLLAEGRPQAAVDHYFTHAGERSDREKLVLGTAPAGAMHALERSALMQPSATQTRANVIPCLRYRDAAKAIEWLGRAFGFERHAVYPNDDGTIAHAQLTLGHGMIMLGTATDSEFGRLMKQPRDVGGGTQSVYVVVPDVDAHYARARDAGAEIVIDLRDEDYGGRVYTCRDLEGHVWTFGSYDPWVQSDT